MKGYVYILTNKNNTVLYTGVTSDMKNRIKAHKVRRHPDSFSAQYNLYKLVYFEVFETIGEAIAREKIIKGSSRKRKLTLISSVNPEWSELSSDLFD